MMTLNRLTRVIVALSAAIMATACTNEVDNPNKNTTVDPEYVYDDDYYTYSTDTCVTGKAESITYSTAILTGKLNLKTASSVPAGSQYGILVSASTDDPQIGGDGVKEIKSTTKVLIYKCQATGLAMGTTYYYRAYLREGGTRKIHYGKVFAFVTEKCDVETLDASAVGFCSATVRGKSSIKLNQASFNGSFGVLFSSRQTDKPNAQVDKFISGKVAPNDSTTFEVQLSDLTPGNTYVYQAYLKIDTAYYYGTVKSVTTHSIVFSDSDLPVDLGLSVRWASRNIGAESAELAGTYFGYGDPTGEMTTSDYTQYPNQDICGTEYDMASENWGVGWQLPSWEQVQELADNCDWLWTTFRDVKGYAILSRTREAAIFLPACGYAAPGEDGRTLIGEDMADPVGFYWTGNKTNYQRSAYSLKISSLEVDIYNLGDKSHGFNVRAIAE